MAKRIVIIQGHPDPAGGHLLHAMADAYATGANRAGGEVRRTEVAALQFPLLRTQAEFESGVPPEGLGQAAADLQWAEHIVILFPLWLGTMPALLKGFLEQTMRPHLAFDYVERGMPRKLLAGRSARVIVTMGMPALAYRWIYGAHGVRGLERSILKFVGMKPVRRSLYGMVAGVTEDKRKTWLKATEALGAAGR